MTERDETMSKNLVLILEIWSNIYYSVACSSNHFRLLIGILSIYLFENIYLVYAY